ncbi:MULTISPECIES: ANTAR domain-containing response regulator [Brevibacillus]|jgi:Response regulator with putative antiterminator output domain|uniref:Transcriptional regulator n=2 Tax=Brevibacillus TaxID=55080 RepID=A0A4Y3PCL0_BREPA|nr:MULTISPECIES: response regulator [Brevibacillus]KZE49345.1 Fis family transcriptional regulator [Brevibacillus parabrevis]MBU8713463.1 response regulator [Brevibacillus parabrevis]MDH6351091.1 AmiR/NasT family two-component response regulator [Brevibacillus sp. 1238]MDR4997659.1 response regulator [Brevibacillus parabrevis]MED1722619.1 response regulator [Brevibacillus parabrevis]
MTQPKIMVVDDEPIIRMDLREMLENEGYQVVAEAKNGEEAVELAHRHKPDLIIMDVKMPGLNGIKASGIIRTFSDCSILLLTAYSQKELVLDARKAGVTAYLVKPVSEDDLIPAVEIALSQKEKVVSLKKDISDLKQKIEDRKAVEKAKGKLMSALSLEEEAAYKWMQQVSMQRRMPLVKLAEEILSGEQTILTQG